MTGPPDDDDAVSQFSDPQLIHSYHEQAPSFGQQPGVHFYGSHDAPSWTSTAARGRPGRGRRVFLVVLIAWLLMALAAAIVIALGH